jgi:hypothetical protein
MMNNFLFSLTFFSSSHLFKELQSLVWLVDVNLRELRVEELPVFESFSVDELFLNFSIVILLQSVIMRLPSSIPLIPLSVMCQLSFQDAFHGLFVLLVSDLENDRRPIALVQVKAIIQVS